jgi:uncharacterized protein YndB with AHSA1/START domain
VDRFVTVAAPIEEVFDRVTQPADLGRWLPELRRVEPEPGVVGVPFAVLLGSGEVPGRGELVACEPPRHAEFRFLTAHMVSVIRLTCTRTDSLTRVHVHQDDRDGQLPLRVDVESLQRTVALPRRWDGTR